MEESPSDSGCSDGTKATHQEDILDSSSMKNSAIIDLSKPLSKEEMLAIIQILRELWKKQFGSELPDSNSISVPPPPPPPPPTTTTTFSSLLKKKSLYHSTPSLNKLSAELSDIKDKLKRFSTSRSTNDEVLPSTQPPTIRLEEETETIRPGRLVFIPLGSSPTVSRSRRFLLENVVAIFRRKNLNECRREKIFSFVVKFNGAKNN